MRFVPDGKKNTKMKKKKVVQSMEIGVQIKCATKVNKFSNTFCNSLKVIYLAC